MLRYRKNKIILLGPSGVGKTSILEYIKGNPFNNKKKPTIGVDFYVHEVKLSTGKIVELMIWI